MSGGLEPLSHWVLRTDDQFCPRDVTSGATRRSQCISKLTHHPMDLGKRLGKGGKRMEKAESIRIYYNVKLT